MLLPALVLACAGLALLASATTLVRATAPQAAFATSAARPDGARLLYSPAAPASAQNAAFSPNGRSLLFTLFHRGYNDGPAGLYLLSLPGGGPTVLLDEADQDSVNLPGSSWIASSPFLRRTGNAGVIAFASDRRDNDEIWTMAVRGRRRFRVTRHTSSADFIEPSFSPDGRWIVFELSNGDAEKRRRGSIWKVRADGRGLTRLTDGPRGGSDDRQPNWSPLGNRILFQRRTMPGGDWEIYTMAPNGDRQRNVTRNHNADDTDASWSPNGACIAYSSDNGSLPRPSIFARRATGGKAIRVTYSSSSEDGAPSWSPDGRWISFESHLRASETSRSALWRIAAKAGKCRSRRGSAR